MELTIEERKKKIKLVDGKPFYVIVHNPNNLPMMKLEDIEDLQGDLKEFVDEESELDFLEILHEKGVVMPFFAWKDKKGKSWMLDGSGRRKLVNKYDIQSKKFGKEFPILFIPAKSKQKAAELILQISSNWHKTTKIGMQAFMESFNLDFDFINTKTTFDFFQLPKVPKTDMDAFFEEAGGEKTTGNKFKIILEYSVEKDYQFVLDELKKISKTPEGAILKLIEHFTEPKPSE